MRKGAGAAMTPLTDQLKEKYSPGHYLFNYKSDTTDPENMGMPQLFENADDPEFFRQEFSVRHHRN